MKVILYSNEVIPPKMRVDQHLYSTKENVRIVFLPIMVDEETKRKHYDIVQNYYTEIGIEEIQYIDLTKKASKNILSTVKEYEVFHFSGGNTLETLVFFKESGVDAFLKSLMTMDKIFIGHCGGAVLLSSNASWIRLRTEDIDEVLTNHPRYQALGLVNFEFIPHYNRFKKEKEFIKKVVEYSIGIPTPIYTCKDGDGLIVKDGNITFFGDFVEISHGEKYYL